MAWTILLVALVHLLGIAAAITAIMRTRTAQGTIAWIIALTAFPYLALPLYFIFGRDKFAGYVRSKKIHDKTFQGALTELSPQVLAQRPKVTANLLDLGVAEQLGKMPATEGNAVKLLIDGEETFDHIFRAIEEAMHDVVVQFYIVRDDGIGGKLKHVLMAAARRGVGVWFLFDAIGSHQLTKAYVRDLKDAGVNVAAFRSTKIFRQGIQANFRNHRKIVVVDGRIAYIGGHNVGDEYLGLDPKLGRWRDTHIEIKGPAALAAQLIFAEDWHWSAGVVPLLNWRLADPQSAGLNVAIVPMGPADTGSTGASLFAHLITRATKRVWLSVPYFVPGEALVALLQIAVLRRVDVRIIVSGISDNWLSNKATESYLNDVLEWNVRVFRFKDGFLHQKVLLIDDAVASVGSANFDVRSFRLNFEITGLVDDPAFAKTLEAMLIRDMEQSVELDQPTFASASWLTRFQRRLARILTPVL